MSDVTKGDDRKEFEKWMVEEKFFPQINVAKSIDRVQNLPSISVFEIDKVDNLVRFQKSIMKTLYFKRLSASHRISCIITFQLYKEFLSQRTEEQISDVKIDVVGAQANVVISAEGSVQAHYSDLKTGFSPQPIEYVDTSKVFNCNSLITVVMHDQQFRPLIDALHQDNIVTLGQLININVISYINSKNLYSWKDRLIVWEGLRLLLDPYRSTFENKILMQTPNPDVSDVDELISAVTANKGLNKADIRNRKSYTQRKPQKFILQGVEFSVTCWIEVLIGVCEALFKRYPSQMAALQDQPVGKGGLPVFGRNRNKFLYAKTLSNELYVDAQLSAYGVLYNSRAVCQKCGIEPDELEVFTKSKKAFEANSQVQDKHAGRLSVIAKKSSSDSVSTQVVADIARFIKACGLSGCSSGDIQSYSQLKNRTIVNLLAENANIVEICKGKYIHRDGIVDLEEAANTIKSILVGQFEQFLGYSSARLLYEAVRIDLSMFLNDNDFNDIDTIYYLAKHLFCKESYGGEMYIFYGNTHIWRQEPDYPMTVNGLLIHYARMAQNRINLEECESFLRKLGFSAGSTKHQMQNTLEPTFLQYDADEYLLGETLCINEQWTNSITKNLDELFKYNDFVISRDIQNEWYAALPSLPFGLPWTRLLLQEILSYYPDIGYRTISALAGQATDTIRAAIVPKESSISAFADFVSAFFLYEEIPSQRLSAEELRSLLRQRGILEGNELYCNMSKALDDYRFAWDNENKTVLVNVGC